MHELRRRWADYEFTAIAAPFPIGAIPPPGAYPHASYLHIPGRGTALVSDPIDQAIAATGIPAQLDDEAYRLPRDLKGSAPYVLPVRNHGRLVFNGKIIGMRGDPLPPAADTVTDATTAVPGRPASRPPIRLHIARFFDAQCSNEVCTLRVAHRETGEEFDPRTALLTNANGQLKTLAESTLADCVGISTIAFTADGQLVLTRQTSRNTASALLLAPSGSGSLDPRDLGPATTSAGPGTRAAVILQDVVRRGMERELCEETGIRHDEIRHTKVIGFARWLERGAKPEFFGITQLSATVADIAERHRHLTSDERLYTGGIFTLTIDLARLGQELTNGTDLLDARGLPPRIKEDGSPPLLLALRAAALHHVSAAA